ncbi:MAG: hypothetical protein CMK65_11860 [Pseudoalteromonas sp.]|uniref:hypothetical protein n=1 Tax=Pseudoalteromonas sp. TaxID=53249 RepID=UPI000C8966C8|nr:hypothetical protein [Pseudoalteromonas sp.]MAD04294.1 hypothetical protein [Pseudoalteromonas sp.]
MDDMKKVPYHNSSYYESIVRSDFNSHEPTCFRYPLSATSIVVPALKASPKRVISFDIKGEEYKRLIFKAIIASYNYSFLDEFAPLSAKYRFTGSAHLFVEWLNNTKIKNPYTVLKEYESYRFDTLNNHGGQSALRKLRTVLFYALERSSELSSSVEPEQLQYLFEIYKTKVSPNFNKKQISLAGYFGELDWLRSDDIGIGNQLYQVLASPKISIRSLRATASSIIIELYECKLALKRFLELSDFSLYDFEMIGPNKNVKYYKKSFTGRAIFCLLYKYHYLKEKEPKLRNALMLVLLANTSNKKSFVKILPALDSEIELNRLFISTKGATKGQLSNSFLSESFSMAGASSPLFGFNELKLLCSGTQNLPISEIENLLFSWLMASLAVQPSDIGKLSKNSFRYLKIGGRVTHIECEYFKGRANSIHTTHSISTKLVTGKAIYCYISQCGDGNLVKLGSSIPGIFNGFYSVSGVLSELLNFDFIREKVHKAHLNSGDIPPVISEALIKLIKNGVHSKSNHLAITKKPISEREVLARESGSLCHSALFGLQAIKNSAVHAFSDPYTLYYLTNRNSHTNRTEKMHYLNSDNEEWINASGRITRNVMIDLINNVFNLAEELDENEISRFNDEFYEVTEHISRKSHEMIMRLKVVTNQQKGRINEVGVLSPDDRQETERFDYIYVIDSPLTVFKMKNYLYEFEVNYKKLLSVNPSYLYKTVVPTVEWISYVLSILTKHSILEGSNMFKKMKLNNVSISVFHSI